MNNTDVATFGCCLVAVSGIGILRAPRESVRRPCCVRGSSCVGASVHIVYIYTTCICIYMYMYIFFIYEIPSKFALIKSLLECASDGGRRMKSVQARGNSQKTMLFLFAHACAFWGVGIMFA